MSSLSIKSHNRSITSCTCFMHFPCDDKRNITLSKQIKQIYKSVAVFVTFSIYVLDCLDLKEKRKKTKHDIKMTGSAGILSMEQTVNRSGHSHPRHRSPQCRVFLYAGTGIGPSRPGRERRRRCCSDSRLYRMSLFL